MWTAYSVALWVTGVGTGVVGVLLVLFWVIGGVADNKSVLSHGRTVVSTVHSNPAEPHVPAHNRTRPPRACEGGDSSSVAASS